MYRRKWSEKYFQDFIVLLTYMKNWHICLYKSGKYVCDKTPYLVKRQEPDWERISADWEKNN